MAIIAKNLSKNYGKKQVLHDISFEIPEQPTIVGLIGPNGVGKSTMLRLLAGVLIPTDGEILNDKVKETYYKWACVHSTFVPSGERGLIYRLTTIENLRYFASFKGINLHKAEKVLRSLAESLDFSELLDKKFQELSTGQKKKAAILVGASLETSVLLLDEPSNGLDINAQDDLARFIVKLKDLYRKMIFVSSHDTQMLSGVVNCYLFFKNGQIVKQVNHHFSEEELIRTYQNVYR